MRSAPCALAPSHSYHAMPPRITRNSHRPRASDRTMVNAESPVSLAALTNSTASPRHRGNLREWTTSQTSPGRQTYLQWAGSRDTISLSGRSGVFFLTSLFIELIEAEKCETVPVTTERPRWPLPGSCSRLSCRPVAQFGVLSLPVSWLNWARFELTRRCAKVRTKPASSSKGGPDASVPLPRAAYRPFSLVR
jgi:hypothetical protein